MGLSGLAGLGYAAGGFATGMQQGAEMRRRDEEEKRRKEQYDYDKENRERQKRIREATSGELAAADKDVPVDYQIKPGATGNLDEGGAYTPVTERRTKEEAWKRASSAAAKAGASPQEVADIDAKGLAVRKGEREEGDQKTADATLALMRRLQAGEDPAKVFHEGAALYRNVPDGKHASVSEDGKHFVLYDEQSGTSKVVPASPQVAMQALQHLYDMSSPQAYQKGQERGLKEREVAAHEANAKRQGEFYQSGGVYERTHQAGLRAQLSMARMQGNSRNFDPAGFLSDNTPISYDRHSGRYYNAFTGVPLNEGQLKLLPKMTGQQRPDIQGVQGNPGFVTVNGKLHKIDDQNNRLIPIGDSLIDQLKAQGPGMQGPQQQGGGSGLQPRSSSGGWSEPMLPTADRRAAMWREMRSDMTGGNATPEDLYGRMP